MNRPNAHPRASEAERFQALEKHAEGGLGSVFRAHDAQLNRTVAVKEIRHQFADDAESRNRFLREAEITARLEHPGIVPVYALGQYEDGRPYYAMRMIQGVSLREAVNELHERRATDDQAFDWQLRKLLNRFIVVCNTLEYAHSRGVLHRDLKPDNIMLGPFGETLVVDWGLAKVIAQGSHDDRLAEVDRPAARLGGNIKSASGEPILPMPGIGSVTRADLLIGTPGYVSPEQALSWHDALTPASDVYSLGATLYTLVTGRVPDVGHELATLLVRTRAREFPTPRQLVPTLAPALEAVCMKALAGSANQRYASAADFAADLEAYLADEPVTAWREPWRVRAARWMRRHRTWVVSTAGAAVVAIVLLGVLVASQKTANTRLRLSRDRELKNFQLAREAVDRYFTRVSEDPRLTSASLGPLRRDLLGTAGDFYEQFTQQDAADRELPYELGWARYRLASIVQEIGSTPEAIQHLEQAARAFRNDLTVAANREGVLFCQLALVPLYDRVGRLHDAEAALGAARTLAGQLAEEFNQAASFQNQLARCCSVEAGRLVRRADFQGAEALYLKEAGIRERIEQLVPQNSPYQQELSTLHQNLAVVYQRLDQLAEARQHLDLALQIDRRRSQARPQDAEVLHGLAQTLILMGDLQLRLQATAPAQNAYAEALRTRSELVQRHPEVLPYRAEWAQALNHVGSYHYDRGETSQADECFRLAVTQADRLVSDYPQDIRYQRLLVLSTANCGRLYAATDRFVAAEELLRRSQELRQQLTDASTDPEQAVAQADVWRELATIERKTGRLVEAEKHLSAALERLEHLAMSSPEIPKRQEVLYVCRREWADWLRTMQRTSEALEVYRRVYGEQHELKSKHPALTSNRISLATTCVQWGSVLLDQDQTQSALSLFGEAQTELKEVVGDQSSVEGRTGLRNAYAGSALALERMGQLQEALGQLDHAIELGTPNDTVGLRLKRALLRASAGPPELAISEADALVGEATGYGPALFELAKVYAMVADRMATDSAKASDQQDPRIVSYDEKAVSLIQAARQAGYFQDEANRSALHDPPFVNLYQRHAAWRDLRQAIDSTSP